VHNGRVRLFVAVDPPERVVGLLRSLPRPALGDLRWTTPDRWHITLRFLGEVGDPGPVVEALAGVPGVLGGRSVAARLGPSTAWFPGRRILQVPVAGLDVVAGVVHDATAPWGPVTEPAFTGHLTLARVRGRTAGPASLAGTPFDACFDGVEVVLYASSPGPGGSTYEVVSTVPLEPGPG